MVFVVSILVAAAVSAVHVVAVEVVVVVVVEGVVVVVDENAAAAAVRGGGTPKAIVQVGTVITIRRSSSRGVTSERIRSRRSTMLACFAVFVGSWSWMLNGYLLLSCCYLFLLLLVLFALPQKAEKLMFDRVKPPWSYFEPFT